MGAVRAGPWISDPVPSVFGASRPLPRTATEALSRWREVGLVSYLFRLVSSCGKRNLLEASDAVVCYRVRSVVPTG